MMECPTCLAQIEVGQSTCPECGAAFNATGKDEGVYPELAKANLLRMRGDTTAAESQLLSLLKRYPNNATAHEMLGDLYFEAHDDGQAAQWFELAIDLAPDTPGLANKLQLAKERLAAKDRDTTVETIGLKPTNNRMAIGIGIAAVIVLILAVGIYALVKRNSSAEVIRSTLDAPVQPSATPSPSSSASPSGRPIIVPSATPSPAVVEDQSALTTLTQKAPEGNRLLALTSDPRSQTIQMTFNVRENEDPRPIGAKLAKAALDLYPACSTVTVRASKEGNLVYVADATRMRYMETQTAEWQAANPSSDAWQTHVLGNEWSVAGEIPAPSAAATPVPSAGTTSGIVPVGT